jgi:hypothetical protein
MSEKFPRDDAAVSPPLSTHELLLMMDLATEVLEGLDELGLDNRAQVEALLADLERQVGDAS